MKNKEIDHDNYDEVFKNEAAFNKRFRRLEGEELSQHKLRIAKALAEKKSRVTIYFDSDIIRSFKERSAREGIGYQTLINEALRSVVERDLNVDIKEDMLKDKKFLKRLKSALSA